MGRDRQSVGRASDADGDTLGYTLLYSADNRGVWQPLVVNLEANDLLITEGLLHDMPGSSEGKLKVIASDGVNTGEDSSDDLFTVPGSPPDVLILTPEDGATVALAAFVSFPPVAGDVEDISVDSDGMTDQASVDVVIQPPTLCLPKLRR